jgi:hypothetical protein
VAPLPGPRLITGVRGGFKPVSLPPLGGSPGVAGGRWYISCVNPLGWLDRLGAQRTEKGQVLYVLYVIIAVLVIIVLLRILGVV